MHNSFSVPFDSSPLYERWGHHAAQILMFTIAGAIVLGAQPIGRTASGQVLSMTLACFVLATWLAMRQHDRRLCEWCVQDLPLDVEGAANQARYRFRLAHLGNNPGFVVPYLSILIATNFLPGQTGRLVWAIAQSTMIYLVMASDSHRKLQPWCPICREGGGGSDRVEIDPTSPRGRDRELV